MPGPPALHADAMRVLERPVSMEKNDVQTSTM